MVNKNIFLFIQISEYDIPLFMRSGETAAQLRNEELLESDDLMDQDLGGDPVFVTGQRSIPRVRVSRAQWFRYMIHQRPKLGSQTKANWRDSHWLWNWRKLAQLYTVSYCNRMEAQKVQFQKKRQERIRYVRPQALVDWLEKQLESQGTHVSQN